MARNVDFARGWLRPLAAAWALALSGGWCTAARATELRVHGLLDVAVAERGPAYDFNVLTRRDSPFDPYGLRLFVDATVNDRVQVFTQLVMRDATTPYVDGAYAVFSPYAALDLHLQAGKVPWPIGTYAPRTYSNKNPLVGSPLMYQYHTTHVWYDLVPNADALLASSGTGQYRFGMPIVDDSYWDVGAAIVGSQRPFEYAIGMGAGTPGWGSTSQDENSGKSVLGRVGFVPWPGVRLGVSGAYGPYLVAELNPLLPSGRNVNDYHQKLGMTDLELLAGHFELRAEGARNVWETPTVGDLEVDAGYVELKYAFSFGGFVAGRWDAMRFGEITDSGGNDRPWDSHVTRVETGIGYRFDPAAIAKLVYQHTELETAGAAAPTRDLSLFAGQLVFSF